MHSILLNLLLQVSETPEPTGLSKWSTPIMFGLIMVVFYFFMIRPQQKKQKAVKGFQNEIKKGDNIVTIGGIEGRIASMEDNHIYLEVDKNVKLRIQKSAISMENSAKLNS